MEDVIGGLMVVLAVLMIVGLIAREAVTWYWKINEELEVLQGIRSSLEELAARLGGEESVRLVRCGACEEYTVAGAESCVHCEAPLP